MSIQKLSLIDRINERTITRNKEKPSEPMPCKWIQ
jgi:hypothetical protein